MDLLDNLTNIMMKSSYGICSPDVSRKFILYGNVEFITQFKEAILEKQNKIEYVRCDDETKTDELRYVFVNGITIYVEEDEDYNFPVISAIFIKNN